MQFNKTLQGLIWTFLERVSAQLVSVVVGIILARLLSPNEYGIISIVMIFITICNVFVTRGFGATLVQKNKVDNLDYNTAFWISLLLALALYALLFLVAPYIEAYYKIPSLAAVIRVLSLRVPLAAVNSIQQAYIQRQMLFKKFFWATLIGTIVSGFVGVVLAYSGFGVWALVTQYLCNVILDTIILSFVSGLRIGVQISVSRLEYIVKFGGSVLLSDLISVLADNFRNFIVAKRLGPADLSYLEQGKKYPQLIAGNLNTAIQKVFLSVFSRDQDNIYEIKRKMRKAIKIGAYIFAPIMIGFSCVSSEFISTILTDKWMPVRPFLISYAVGFILYPAGAICSQAILAIGKSSRVFKILLYVSIIDISLSTLAVYVLKTSFYICISIVIATFISNFLFLFEAKKEFNYLVTEQLRDVMPSVFASCIMATVVCTVGVWIKSTAIAFILKILTGIVVYIFINVVCKTELFLYFNEMRARRNNKNDEL